MKIHLRPYAHDTNRWHVDIRLMHPTETKEIRKRLVAPAGLSEAQARTWGERQVPKILGKVLGAGADAPQQRDKEETPTTSTPRHLRVVPSPKSSMTLGALYIERFEPEYVRLQKPATRVNYDTLFRNHLGPHLGGLPLAAIDEDRLSTFRAELRQRLGVTTTNLVLSKLARILRFAKRVGLLAVVPDVEKFPVPRTRPKAVLSDDQIEALLEAAAALGTSAEVVVLLAVEAGLRAGEICALEWADVDMKEGAITVQNNSFRGEKQTPKGTIARIAMTSALRRALERHRRQEPVGPLVLYRRSHHTRGEWAPHTPHSLREVLIAAQRRADLPRSGPHLLRHTALTRLANLGASVYVIQAVARHSRLQTTQAYLHTQQASLVREAADLVDRARQRSGKNSAKQAKHRRK